jgi:putative inorganic carbon (HCO3(-)) transporter
VTGHGKAARRWAAGELPGRPALFAAAAFVFGAFYALTASRLAPWALPGAVVLGIGAWVAYERPAIGIALGLVVIPIGTLGLNQQLIAYLTTGWSAYLAAVAYRRHRELARPESLPAIASAVVLYACVTVLSVTQSVDLSAAGHLVRSLFTGVLLFAATMWTVRDRQSLTWVLGGAAGGAFIVGMHAISDYLSGAPSSAGFITSSGELVGRVTAGFSQPNQLGGFLVVLVPLAVAGALTARRGRPLFAAAAFAAAVGVYTSFSRGALIGLALIPFVFLRGWRMWLVGLLVAVVAVVSAPSLLQERFATLTSSGADIATRTDIWRTALNIWENHPILGVGLGGFPQAYATAPVPGKLFLPSTVFEPPPHAHNVFLQLVAEQGVLGVLAFVAILAAAARTALRLRAGPDHRTRMIGSGLLAALIVFTIHNLFDVTLEDPQTGLYVFMLLGLIAACGVTWGTGTQGA